MRNKIRYKEEFFQLYNRWLYSDLDSTSRNIFFLELAYTMPFNTPIKALVPVTNETQYDKYKSLLMMRICVLLAQEYINYANFFMKEHIYFYNREFFKDYLDGYDIAEFYYNSARKYWHEAIEHARIARSIRGFKMDLNFNGWNYDFEEEAYRIVNGMVYYDETIDRRLARIERNRRIINQALENEGN
jgi:hypothetical protein